MAVCTFIWSEEGTDWYCTLEAGHDGTHAAGGVGGEVTRWHRPVETTPRTWALPPEPGPEVTAVRCACCTARWERIPWPFRADGTKAEPGTSWMWKSSRGSRRRWRPLVYDHTVDGAPLTDVTAEVQS